jgi:hypothetical protein
MLNWIAMFNADFMSVFLKSTGMCLFLICQAEHCKSPAAKTSEKKERRFLPSECPCPVKCEAYFSGA